MECLNNFISKKKTKKKETFLFLHTFFCLFELQIKRKERRKKKKRCQLCQFNTGFDDNEQIDIPCPDYQQNLYF